MTHDDEFFLPNPWRLATSKYRHLPTAVIVGAQRAGVGYLYDRLVSHPRCFGAVVADVNYFSKQSGRSEAWYRSQFPLAWQVARKEARVIELSPSYLTSADALRALRAALPKALVIVVLREPVARAFSHYQHLKLLELEQRSFEECVATELWANEFPPESGLALRPNMRPMRGYVARGYYGLQLEALLNIVPRNKVLVLESNDLFADPSGVCKRVFNFMGLERPEEEPATVRFRRPSTETVGMRIATRLRSHYGPYDQLLAEIMGQPLSWMQPTKSAAAA